VLWTGGEASERIEDCSEKGVTEHATNVLAVMVNDGDTSLSAGINNIGSNENGEVEATQHIHQHSHVYEVRTSNIIKPSAIDVVLS